MKNIRAFNFHRELLNDTVKSTIDTLDEIPYEYRKPVIELLLLDKIDMVIDALSNGEIAEGTEFVVQDLFTEEEWKYFKRFPGRMSFGKRFAYLVSHKNLPFEKISTDWPSKYVIKKKD